MEMQIYERKPDPSLNVQAIAGLIADTQKTNGEIPWYPGGKTDPWDHVEAAIGLAIGGRLNAAHRAYEWMRCRQNPDGSWFSAYREGEASDKTRETNLSAYIAVGVFHYYQLTRDLEYLRRMWPMVRRAIDFALSLQTPHGDIFWAISPQGRVDKMALLTGCSSICLSIKCALAIANRLGIPQPRWNGGLDRLVEALAHKPFRFNMTKSRYSMDWFYPILAGVLTGAKAQRRIDTYWRKYVIEGQGVRCVYDQPWVTIAETSELSLALAVMGNQELAEIVFGWIADKTYDDGTFWCGFTYPDMTVWPEEKITWTNAVALMAADTLFGLTPACNLFAPPVLNCEESTAI